MAHNLAIGKHGNHAYFGAVEAAWHGLGTTLDHIATAEEAIKAAGLDFEVAKKPLFAKVGRLQVPLENRVATVRTDTNDILGVVGKDYGILQNARAFDFFDALVDKDEAIYHTAGALGKGEKVWVLAKLPDYIRVGKSDDVIEKYLLIYHGHDGRTSVNICFTPVRVVCQNTLQQAMIRSNHSNKISLSHTRNIEDKVKNAYELLGLANKNADQMQQAFTAMSKVKMGVDELDEYLNAVWSKVPGAKKEEDLKDGEDMLMSKKTYEDVIKFYEQGPGQDMKTAQGTLFGAYNAVTGYTDHIKSYNGDKLKSLWFNGGQLIKTAAYKTALEYVNS
jgi:phage/plasmid-like protein (TIGR03299 family)